MRPTRQARKSPTPRLIAAVRSYLAQRCPWETAVSTAGVQRAEDIRWRDAVEAAEESGQPVPDLESQWYALWHESRMTIAEVAGALVRCAIKDGGRDVVAAAKALLPVEGGEAWSGRGPDAGGSMDEAGGLDEVAIERLSPLQRKQMAEAVERALVVRAEVERLLQDARGTVD